MKIAVIPARGGSKRIPGKNIREFAGKPMIAHAIEVAQQSGLFDHIVVSTDDEKIARIARAWGAETPFMRPAELADDYMGTGEVIAHAIETCRSSGWEIDYACCIYPCVPFIQIEDLKQALKMLQASGATYCFPIAEFPSAIQRALRNVSGELVPFHPENEDKRTQDLERAYYDSGQFYWAKSETWLTKFNMHSGAAGLLIPSWRVVDIDMPEDWRRAELMYAAIRNDEGAL